ncbi:MAG: Wzy polymerase domain-containing protein [Rhodospirillaceae bacterium]
MLSVLVVHIVLVKSPYPQQPLLAMIYLVWSAALILLTAALRREFGAERTVAVLAGFVLAGGLLNTIAGVLQHYEWRGPFESIVATKLYFQVYGNLGQPNHFATHIVLALASLGYFYATARMRLKRTIVIALPLLFVLALSGSRSSWFYLLGIVGLALLSYRVARTAETRRTLHFAVVLIPGLIAAHLISQLPFLAPPTLQETTIDRIFSLASTSSDRLQLWREAWAMFMSAPVFGVGWGQFAWHNFMLTGQLEGSPLRGLYNHAHNLLLQLLAETGAIGAGIVLIGTLVWIRHAWPLLSKASGWWIWSCVAVLGLHSMLEYPLWNTYFLGIACVLLGLSDTRTLQLHQARLVRLGVIVLIAGTAWIGTMMLDRYHRLESVIYARYGDKNGLALEQAHREMLAVRASFFLVPYVDLAYARDIALNVTDIDRKLAFTARVMHFAPTGMVAYRHAALKALAGNESEARAILSRAVIAYPMMLETFVREFAAADTGNREAQARFLTELQRHAAKRRSDDRSSQQ